ncbi:MAG: hypothetical protein KC777_08070 [Cyanobacteria bacterium HKST-UBA02]|nr:hypothetical protein [Cyanobacteria bacterium HKST-UBA02]
MKTLTGPKRTLFLYLWLLANSVLLLLNLQPGELVRLSQQAFGMEFQGIPACFILISCVVTIYELCRDNQKPLSWLWRWVTLIELVIAVTVMMGDRLESLSGS